jgi:hypothetical protein
MPAEKMGLTDARAPAKKADLYGLLCAKAASARHFAAQQGRRPPSFCRVAVQKLGSGLRSSK